MHICVKIVPWSIRQSVVPLAMVIALLILPSHGVGAASIRGLGDLPGGGFFSMALGVSRDGTVVVGRSDSLMETEAFRWTPVDGIVGLGTLPGGTYSYAAGVSGDGTVVVGGSDSEAFRWTPVDGIVGLGTLPGGRYSGATGVSGDGTVVVGLSNATGGTQAFRWTLGAGIVGLGFLPGGTYSYAAGVSGDGTVVVGSGSSSLSGNDYFEAFRWTPQGGMVGLGTLPGGAYFHSEAAKVSGDGTVVVGSSRSALGDEAFRWTLEGGMVGLGFLPGGTYSGALGVSGDGSVVVGFSTSAQGFEAFIWDKIHGMRRLQDVLTQDFGVDLTGWRLDEARDISADGRTIVGLGRSPSGHDEAWVVHLDKSLMQSDTEGPLTSEVVAMPNPVAVNTAIALTAQVDDTPAGGAPIATADYGIDGSSLVPMAAQDSAFDAAREAVVAVLPPFATAGVHEVCVSGMDTVGNLGSVECILLAVFDPTAGFVTGGGWITSPPGAYTPDPTLIGRANFGFVSKYQKGATVPTGETVFQFKVANLNFHSDTYEWLVVSGARAQFKGTGMINGSGPYGFLLTAIDGQIPGGGGVDKFRLKIWNTTTAAIVYDNKLGASDTGNDATELDGGSIVIRTK